ncbi:hypothetical protein CHUAL_009241 [Chamberlinius hualienensis]
MDKFRPTNEDYFSRRNSYNVNVEDAGVALTGQESNQEDICHFSLIGRKCRRGVYCKFTHPKPHELPRQKIHYQIDEPHQLQLFHNKIFAVDVTAVISPIRFYAQLTEAEVGKIGNRKVLYKNEELVNKRVQFFQYIQQLFRSEIDRFGDNHQRVVSEMVVAKSNDAAEWRRGKISAIHDDKFLVYFVDFGVSELIDDINIRDLPTELLQVPFEAYECSLNMVELNPKTNFVQATDYLNSKLKFKDIFGIVKDCQGSELSLELYDISNPSYELKINDLMINKEFVLKSTTIPVKSEATLFGAQPG